MAAHEVFVGREHHYRILAEIGRGLFRAEDERGRPVALRVGAKELLFAQAGLTRLLPEGLLPRIVEYREIQGGRTGFLVTEFIHGYSLLDLVLEGRRLARNEALLLVSNLSEDLTAFARSGLQPEALRPKDVVYDTFEKRFRLTFPGRWRRESGEGALAGSIARLALDVAEPGAVAGSFGAALRTAAANGGHLYALRRAAGRSTRRGATLLPRISDFLGFV